MRTSIIAVVDFPRKNFHFTAETKRNHQQQVNENIDFTNEAVHNCHKLSFNTIRTVIVQWVNAASEELVEDFNSMLASTTDDTTRGLILSCIRNGQQAETKQLKLAAAKEAIQLWNNSSNNLRPGFAHSNIKVSKYLDPNVQRNETGQHSMTPKSKRLSAVEPFRVKAGNNCHAFFTSNSQTPISEEKCTPETRRILKEQRLLKNRGLARTLQFNEERPLNDSQSLCVPRLD